MIGGAGNDHLNGGGGHDTFVFAGNFGYDTITHFGASNQEKIDLSAVAGITGFHDLVNHHLFDDPGGSGFALIDDGAGNTILLEHVTVADFSVSPRLFGGRLHLLTPVRGSHGGTASALKPS